MTEHSGRELPVPSKSSNRDLRIDLVRGIALLILVTDHIPGNPVRTIMPVSWGLADMAEVFVLLSGYVFGLGIQRKKPPQPSRIRLLRRAFTIFIAYLMTAFLALLFVRAFGNPAIANMLPAHLLTNSWRSVVIDLPTLDGRITHLCILLLYCWLLLGVAFLPRTVWKRPMRLISGSFLLWLTVQIFPIIQLTEQVQTTTYYNPFAWQFLFLSGTVYALLPVSRKLHVLSLPGVLPLILVTQGTLYLTLGFEIDLPGQLYEKPTLGLFRYLHVITAALLLRAILPTDFSPKWKKLTRPLILCSEQSLWVYCGGSLLTIVLTPLLNNQNDLSVCLLVNLLAWSGCLSIAWIVERIKKLCRLCSP